MTRIAPTTAPHTATRDAVLATRTGSLASYGVTTDRGVFYRTLGPVPGHGDAAYAIADAGASAGLVVLVTRTGHVDVRGRGRQVRVRVDYPRDTGDAAGTLAFDAGHVGGVAPRVLFA
jgi:hypothetical protein